jgi:DNA-binding transcriptional LysR family regulator
VFAPKSAFAPPAGEPTPPGGAGNGPELLAPNFTLRQLVYFVAAVQHESVQRAAEALHVSSPAVSAAIAHLEKTLGVQLFVRRHARGLLPTDAGNALAMECRNLLGQSWSLGAGRAARTREVHGWVHLGCLLSFAPFLVPPLVRDFQKRFPKARVYWREGNHEYLMEGLRHGAFELAILYDFEVPSGIACEPLRPAPLQAVLAADHPLARRKSVGIADLAHEPLVLLDLPRTREYLLSAFSAAGIAPQIAYRVQSISMLRSLVASGLGYTLLNFCPPYTNPMIGALVTRPLDTPLRSPNMVVARSQHYQPTPAARALIECTAGVVRHLAFSAGRARRR